MDTAKKTLAQKISGLFVRDKGFYKTVATLALPIVMQNMITMGDGSSAYNNIHAVDNPGNDIIFLIHIFIV